MRVSIEFGKTAKRDALTAEAVHLFPEIHAMVEKKTKAPSHFIADGLDPEHIAALEKLATKHDSISFRVLPDKPLNAVVRLQAIPV